MSAKEALCIKEFVEKSMETFPSATKIGIIIDQYEIVNRGKKHVVEPIAFVVKKSDSYERFYDYISYIDHINLKSCSIIISDSQLRLMKIIGHCHWMLHISCSDQKKYGKFAYYSTLVKRIENPALSKKVLNVDPNNFEYENEIIYDDD